MSKTLPNIILTPEELENIKKNSSSYVSGAEGIIIKEPDRRVVKKILLSEVKEDMDKSLEDIEQIRRNKQSSGKSYMYGSYGRWSSNNRSKYKRTYTI